MRRAPQVFTRTDARVPDTTLFRSERGAVVPADLGHDRVEGVDGVAGPVEADRDQLARLQVEHAVAPDRQVDPDGVAVGLDDGARVRSEEHTSELQSLMRISYAVCCLKTKNDTRPQRVIEDRA